MLVVPISVQVERLATLGSSHAVPAFGQQCYEHALPTRSRVEL